ncbi:MAG: ATP-binding protein [Pseudomonadota bacterium]
MTLSVIDTGLLEKLDRFLCIEGGKRKDAPYCDQKNRQAVDLTSYSSMSSALVWKTPVEVRFCRDFNALNRDILSGQSGAGPAALKQISDDCGSILAKHVRVRIIGRVSAGILAVGLGALILKILKRNRGGDDPPEENAALRVPPTPDSSFPSPSMGKITLPLTPSPQGREDLKKNSGAESSDDPNPISTPRPTQPEMYELKEGSDAANVAPLLDQVEKTLVALVDAARALFVNHPRISELSNALFIKAGQNEKQWVRKEWNKLPPEYQTDSSRGLLTAAGRLGRLAPFLRSGETADLIRIIADRFEKIVLEEAMPNIMAMMTQGASLIGRRDQEFGKNWIKKANDAAKDINAKLEQLQEFKRKFLSAIQAVEGGMVIPDDATALDAAAIQQLRGVAHDTGNILSPLIAVLPILIDEKDPEAIRSVLVGLKFDLSSINGLFASARWLSEKEAKRRNIQIKINALETDAAVPPEIKRQLFRFIFEGFYNAVQHSGGTQVTATASQSDGKLNIAISDNGPGLTKEELRAAMNGTRMSPGKSGKGNGIAILRELCRANGWKFDIISEPGKGTTVMISIADEWATGSGKTPASPGAGSGAGNSGSVSAAAMAPGIVVAGVSGGVSKPRMSPPHPKHDAAWRHRIMASQSHPDASDALQRGAGVLFGAIPAAPPPVAVPMAMPGL